MVVYSLVRIKKLLYLAIFFIVLFSFGKSGGLWKSKVILADTQQPYHGYGHDVSWPQCDVIKKLPKSDFGIVGVTGGKAFTGNPCLSDEYKWAVSTGSASVYINLNTNDDSTLDKGFHGPYGDCAEMDIDCQSKNYGFNAANDAYNYAKSQGVVNPQMWWLDIEELNNWSNNLTYNREVIDGSTRFFADKGLTIGIYSTPIMWKDLTGDYKNNLPVWPAVISNSPSQNCGTGFTGGKIYLIQHNQDELDKNFACI